MYIGNRFYKLLTPEEKLEVNRLKYQIDMLNADVFNKTIGKAKTSEEVDDSVETYESILTGPKGEEIKALEDQIYRIAGNATERFAKTFSNKDELYERAAAVLTEIQETILNKTIDEMKEAIIAHPENEETKFLIDFIGPDKFIKTLEYLYNHPDIKNLISACRYHNYSIVPILKPIEQFVIDFYPDEDASKVKATLALYESPFVEYQEIENYITKRPKNFIIALDKITDLAFSGELSGRCEVLVGPKKTPPAVYVDLDYSALGNGASRLTQEERSYYNGLSSWWEENGSKPFTPQMLYRTVTGNALARTTPNKEKEISDCLMRFMKLPVTIDNTAEAEAFKLPTALNITTSLCYLARIKKTKINGTTLYEAWTIMGTPILLQYAKSRNQLRRFDIKLIDIPELRAEHIAIRDFLLREISLMKGKSKRIQTIKYESLFEYLKIENNNEAVFRNKKKTTRDIVKKILDHLKSDGVAEIKGYEEIHTSRKISGIKITL